MRLVSNHAVGVLAFSASARTVIKQRVEPDAHNVVHDLKHWLLSYPKFCLTFSDGVPAVVGHVDCGIDVLKMVKQMEQTDEIQIVVSIIDSD